MFYENFGDGRDAKFRESVALMKDVFGRVRSADNLRTSGRSVGFLQDPKFIDAMNLHARTAQEKSLAWRLHTLTWAAEQALHKEGDFVECGVRTGFSFGVITKYVDWPSVSKSSPDYNSENRSNSVYEQQNAEDPDAVYKLAQARFVGMPNVQLVRGTVPETFSLACPEKIALLHIDMNSAASEIAALEALWERVVPGGWLIVFDDYVWAMYAAQKEAEDAFMAALGHTIMELPTGQGLLIKH